MAEFDWRHVQDLGNTIARSIDNLADAVRSTVTKPTGVREQELEFDRRAGSALRQLVGHGTSKLTAVRLDDGSWEVLAIAREVGTVYDSIRIQRRELIDALEVAARHWPR